MQNSRGFDLSGTKLFIAIPAYDFKVTLKQAISLAHFSQHAVRHGIDVQIGSICGCSVVSRARNLLVKDFLDSSCDYLMFIDADINFEPEAMLRILAWMHEDSKKGIVGAVPRVRSPETKYIATLDVENAGELTMNGMGLVKATRIATAFMGVRREVFETLINAHPEWEYYDERSDRTLSAVFDFTLQDRGYIGEDFLFCQRAIEEGYEVWIDPTITLGHLGVQEFSGNFGDDVLYPMVVPEEQQVS